MEINRHEKTTPGACGGRALVWLFAQNVPAARLDHYGSGVDAMRAVAVEDKTVGEAIADRVASAIGSWPFIIVQTVAMVIWIAANVLAIRLKWDPYPFVLLNLMFSVQAAYTGPILLLAANRQAQKDRVRDNRDDAEIGEILEHVRAMRGEQHKAA